jgi:hypothetical protein
MRRLLLRRRDFYFEGTYSTLGSSVNPSNWQCQNWSGSIDFQRLTEFADGVLYVGLADRKFANLAEV